MRYLHTMVRVTDLDQSLDFYCNKLGLVQVRKNDFPQGKFTLVFLCAPRTRRRRKRPSPPAGATRPCSS